MPLARTFLPVAVYYKTASGTKIYYETGSTQRPQAPQTGRLNLPYEQQMRITFEVKDMVDHEFMYNSATSSDYVWGDAARNQLATSFPSDADHIFFILGTVKRDEDKEPASAIGQSPGMYCWGSGGRRGLLVLAHEVGHNLGIQEHTHMTFMSASQTSDDANLVQLGIIDGRLQR